MQESISKLIKLRQSYWGIYEDSWSDEKLNYTMSEPKEVDELAKEIFDLIIKFVDELDVDFIIESLTHLGHAPQLVYDDNGHFAFSGDGFNPTPDVETGRFEESIPMTICVEPGQWFDTIREALNHYLKSIDGEED